MLGQQAKLIANQGDSAYFFSPTMLGDHLIPTEFRHALAQADAVVASLGSHGPEDGKQVQLLVPHGPVEFHLGLKRGPVGRVKGLQGCHELLLSGRHLVQIGHAPENRQV